MWISSYLLPSFEHRIKNELSLMYIKRIIGGYPSDTPLPEQPAPENEEPPTATPARLAPSAPKAPAKPEQKEQESSD